MRQHRPTLLLAAARTAMDAPFTIATMVTEIETWRLKLFLKFHCGRSTISR
jgi:hypothetical protein